MKKCQKINLQEPQRNCNATANFVNLLRTSTVYANDLTEKVLHCVMLTKKLMTVLCSGRKRMLFFKFGWEKPCQKSACSKTNTVMRIIKLKIFSVPVHLHSGYGKLFLVIILLFFALFKNVVHSLELGETPSNSASH